jgi:hypothetical protein
VRILAKAYPNPTGLEITYHASAARVLRVDLPESREGKGKVLMKLLIRKNSSQAVIDESPRTFPATLVWKTQTAPESHEY